MKVPAILVSLALATIAVAQAPTLPECAKECADGFLTSGIGNCGGDVACICADSSFISDISCCLVGKCQPPDQSSAIVFASGLCGAYGIKTLPTTVACTSTSSAPASSASTTDATVVSTTSSSDTASSTSTSAATTIPTGSAATTAAATAAASSSASSSSTSNPAPRPTAAAGLGALGGILAAVAML